MEHCRTGCLICGAPLEYFESQRMMECCVCHRTITSNAVCQKGHFICDQCHSEGAVTLIKSVCLNSDSKDPVKILFDLMNLPGVHMHGPEQHIMVGSALMTAYRNCGGPVDLEKALDEMKRRSMQVPGGSCGMWGACGAGISCGIAFSIITSTSPLSKESWGLGNLLTSECLEVISRTGGPRCCKRDGFTAVLTASKFFKKHLGVKMEVPKKVTCTFSDMNLQCLGNRCPYHN